MDQISSSIIVCSDGDITQKVRHVLTKVSIPYIHSPQNIKQLEKNLREDHEALVILVWDSESSTFISEAMETLESVDIFITRPVVVISADQDEPPISWLQEYSHSYHILGKSWGVDQLTTYLSQVSADMSDNEKYLQKLRLAANCAHSDKFEEARDRLLNIPVEQDTGPQIQYFIALVDFLRGEFSDAIEVMEGLSLEGQAQPRVLDLLGRCYMAAKNYAKAARYFEQAFEINAMNIGRQYNLAQASLLSGKYDRAHQLFQRLMELKPSCGRILSGLIQALLLQGSSDEARELMARLGDQESMASVINLAAVIGIKHGLIENGLRLFATSADILSNNWQMLSKFGFNMGVAYYRKRDFENAARCFGLSVVLDPENDKARENFSLLQDYLDSEELPTEPEGAVEALSHFARTA